MSSFISQVMEPGGGLLLLPFVKFVIGCLLILTTTAAITNIARIHMIILSILSTGLLLSLYWFEMEFMKMRNKNHKNHNNNNNTTTTSSTSSTTSTTSYNNKTKTNTGIASNHNNKTD